MKIAVWWIGNIILEEWVDPDDLIRERPSTRRLQRTFGTGIPWLLQREAPKPPHDAH